MSRIPTSIFYVATVTDSISSITMEDRNTYELMENLLNDYLLVWKEANMLLVKDTRDNTKASGIMIVAYVISFFISISALIILWHLIKRFINDREKPIDLFLTIKKKKFEELKNSSESFVNKLLNKFFGNEENEEESMIDYSSNIKPDDINIIKFKTKNEYKNSLQSSGEYLMNYIKIIIFFIVFEGYLSFKTFYNNNNCKNLTRFTDIYNITQYSQSDIILSLDVLKSFLYDDSIYILNNSDTETVLKNTFIDISNSFEYVFRYTYNTSTFLKGNYMKKFYNYINNDISNIVTLSSDYNKSEIFAGTLQHGFKSTLYIHLYI